MDKYLVRTPRSAPNAVVPRRRKKELKQTTIESLKGVVIVEEILRLKAVLKLSDQTPETLIEALEKLSEKIPSRDLLKSTKIGHVVNKLTIHKNKDVSTLSKSLIQKWTQHYEQKLDRPMIEVQSDQKSDGLRTAGRKYLSKALETPSDTLAEEIEREILHRHSRLVGKSYRYSLFKLIRILKRDKELRTQLTDRTLSVSDFVKKYSKL